MLWYHYLLGIALCNENQGGCTPWCCFYAKFCNFCLLRQICTTFILHYGQDVLLSSGTKNLAGANCSTTGRVQMSRGGLTLFADCRSPALYTIQFPYREQLECLRLSNVRCKCQTYPSQVCWKLFLRCNFRPKLKYGYYHPLHTVNERSETFDIH